MTVYSSAIWELLGSLSLLGELASLLVGYGPYQKLAKVIKFCFVK